MDKQKTYIIIGVVIVLVIVGIILLVSKKDSNSTTLTSTLKSPSQLLKAVPLEGYNNLALVDNNGNLNSIPFPRGMIMIWAGGLNEIPDGWAICNGLQGTPDLRGRFVIGVNTDTWINNVYSRYEKGATGGAEQVTLNKSQIPKHTHEVSIQGYYDSGATNGIEAYEAEDAINQPWKYTSNGGDVGNPDGSTSPHNNMPPYYALAYIMKL